MIKVTIKVNTSAVAGNNAVLISVWLGKGACSSECRLII